MTYHVYAEDGYEGKRDTLKAAIRAALNGYIRRGVHYQVIRPVAGYTGSRNGQVVYDTREEGR